MGLFGRMLAWTGRGTKVVVTAKQIVALVLFICVLYWASFPLGTLALWSPKIWCGIVLSLMVMALLIALCVGFRPFWGLPASQENMRMFASVGVALAGAAGVLNGELYFFGINMNVAKEGGLVRKCVFLNDAQYPMGDPQSIVIANGYIIVALNIYGRIQVYDANGTYVNGWFVGAKGGPFEMWSDGNGRLNAVIARGRMLKVYDLKGQLLDSRRVADEREFNDLAGRGRRQQEDSVGNIFMIEDIGWRPKVIVRDGEGRDRQVVADTFCLGMTKIPGPVWHIGVLSLIIIILIRVFMWIMPVARQA